MSKSNKFKDKLIKSHYGSLDEIIDRAESMFNDAVKEMDDLKFSLDLGYVYNIVTNRDKAELINYIITGEPIPERGN